MNSRPTLNIPVIVYVDDDESDLALMEDRLEDKSFSVICESSSLKALNYIRDKRNRIDLLIADLRMPNLSGIELVKRARQYRPDLPTVGVTHYFASKEADELKAITDLCVEKSPGFYQTVSALVHEFLETKSPKSSREALVRRAILTAMQRWYDLEPNDVHMSPELIDDLNFQEFMLQMNKLEALYPGEYVAFVNGKFVDHDIDREALLDRVYKSHGEPVDVFVQRLAKPRRAYLPSPKKAKE